jgi:hypothetical protein
MFAVIAGSVLALFFLGLPLAIIGLFIMSIIDQRSPLGRRRAKKLPTTSQEIVIRYPERGIERPTTKRRNEMVVWRNSSIRREISAHVSEK